MKAAATMGTLLLHSCQESSHLISLTDLILTTDATLFEELRQERLTVTSPRPQLLGYKLKGVTGPGPSHPTSLCFAKSLSLKNNGWCIHAVGQGWSCRVLEIQAKPSGIPDVPRDLRARQRA